MITENLRMGCPQRDSTEYEDYAEALSIYLPEDVERETRLNTEHLMEEVISIPNMIRAMKRVKRNKGAAGVDGMEIPEAMDWLQAHFAEVQEELAGVYYHPSSVRRRVIPKPEGSCCTAGNCPDTGAPLRTAVRLEQLWLSSGKKRSTGHHEGKGVCRGRICMGGSARSVQVL